MKKDLNRPKLSLEQPTINELYYRQKWMMDAETMSYNAGYDINLKGYNKKTGTITKTKEEMISWYIKWIKEPKDKYFAYIYENNGKEPIGEIYYYLEKDIYNMGIVIQSKYRGKGYFKESMNLLFNKAKEKKIKELYDEFEITRTTTYQAFLSIGFKIVDRFYCTKFNKQIEFVKVKKTLD